MGFAFAASASAAAAAPALPGRARSSAGGADYIWR
ncbi:hypothetical protein Bdt_2650 [Bdellovibrio bacteriovorus str. Tiberius]|uniref:Uncharacterized protein n=1 Tax=Bdellovibrio bacteriovorus str. Tiberius TaxID=1069642 RepID=K7ZGC4_BDEBC|nr:hypothetical protein Bdt_2650 [Bdellovibrio bacteriovorus str. Tiberius]